MSGTCNAQKEGGKRAKAKPNRTGVGEKADTSMLTHLKDPPNHVLLNSNVVNSK